MKATGIFAWKSDVFCDFVGLLIGTFVADYFDVDCELGFDRAI